MNRISYLSSFSRLPKYWIDYWDTGLAVVLIILGVLGLRLVTGMTMTDGGFGNSRLGVNLGTVQRERGWVRLRPVDSMIWHELTDRSEAVNKGDVVFSGDDGVALLRLEEVVVNVFPSSLVVIRPQNYFQPENVLSIFGSVFSNVWSPFVRLGIELKEGRIAAQLKSRESSLDVSASGRRVKVLRGDLDAGAGPAVVSLEMDRQSADGTVRVHSTGRVKVEVSDSEANQVLDLENLSQEVLVKASGQAVLAHIQSPVGSPSVPSSSSANEVSSKMIQLLPSLRLTRVRGNTHFKDYAGLYKIPLLLRWTPVTGAESYEVKVYRRDGTVWLRNRTREPRFSLELKSLEMTHLLYGVTAFFPDGRFVQSSRMPITIQLAAPMPSSPRTGSRHSLQRTILLTWARTALTKHYWVQVAVTPSFSSPLLNRRVSKNFLSFIPQKRGRYYWRVKAGAGSLTSAWSDVSAFQVEEK